MIKVKISDLLNSVETLQKLSQKDFKAKLAWQISRMLKAAENEIQAFNETRMTLINKYGEKDENGQLVTTEDGNCKIMPEDIESFSTELTELMNSEVEINANAINFDQLEDVDFTPSEITILEPFINVDEE